MSKYLKHVGVLADEGPDGDVESDEAPPARHELERDVGASPAGGHKGEETDDGLEGREVGRELVELGVSGSAF